MDREVPQTAGCHWQGDPELLGQDPSIQGGVLAVQNKFVCGHMGNIPRKHPKYFKAPSRIKWSFINRNFQGSVSSPADTGPPVPLKSLSLKNFCQVLAATWALPSYHQCPESLLVPKLLVAQSTGKEDGSFSLLLHFFSIVIAAFYIVW